MTKTKKIVQDVEKRFSVEEKKLLEIREGNICYLVRQS